VLVGGGSHVLSFREQSIEITTVPDGAEFYLADGQQSPLALPTRPPQSLAGLRFTLWARTVSGGQVG